MDTAPDLRQGDVDEQPRRLVITDRHFAQLLNEHAGAVSAYARAIAPDRWTADDAAQETFLRAWKYRESFQAKGSFDGWLIRICRNCLVDLAVTNRAQPVPDVPDHVETANDVHDVYDLLARLPIHQREVVAVCGLLGFDYAGAAELLDVPIGTVRSRLHRARAAIAEQLDGTNEEASG